MHFDPRNPAPFFRALIEALPHEWGGACTEPDLTDSHQEDLRRRDLARDALAWAELLKPGETTSCGERILLSWGTLSVRFTAVIGRLTRPAGDTALFVYSLGSSEDSRGQLDRLDHMSSPAEVAQVLCGLARAADRRVVEKHLGEAAAEGRRPEGWFPGNRIVVLDLETTGLYPDTARIVEAAWLLADHRALAWDSVLVNPGIPIPVDAYEIHGIDDALVRRSGLDPLEALDALTNTLAKHIIEGATLVVFNYTYDLAVLDAECRRYGLATLTDRLGQKLQVVDPMRISQQIRSRGSNALADLAVLYSSDDIAPHSALGDCLATWDVLAGLCRSEAKMIVRRLSQGNTQEQPAPPLALHHLVAYSAFE
ncbi:exonuclease domain-containing protein [Streptomyces sp. NPDC058864]